ncbi:MAG: PAS domain-containing protein, partial [Cyclobacteriaceae bacterium]|nr:PAS domain-containing protein [Cyclobacteriaceae bacterium]
RITANKFRSLKQYTEYIKGHNSETEILHNSLLINVTEFFRDPNTFDYISNEIIPKIVNNSTTNEIKIWVVGCATGEEAYTWCILFREYFEKEKVNKFLKIFATDIDVLTLKEARKGVFSQKKVQNIPSKLLEKYFYFSQDEYHVKTEIRNHIIFAEHNIVQDAPYSKMDMMSCRNVLIYLEKELQHIAFSIFHYSLNDNGYLLLGNTESFSAYSSQFKLIDKQFKVFQKLYNPDISRKFINYINYQDRLSKERGSQLTEKPLKEKVHSILLDRFSPPSVVVNNKNEILYIQGKTGQFLELSTGIVKNNILKVCKDSLKVEVAELLLKARKSQREISKKNIAFRIENKPFSIEICITPITSINSISELFLVSFLTEFKTTEKSFKQTQVTSSNGDHILELENELIATKEYLQVTVEELEKTNEQLETSNEELKSTIEELQSINEELETSQEEIQSINEELKEANKRLEDKIFELSNLNSLLNNLMTSIQMPVIFLDLKLNIFNFTPAINEIYNLVESDKGRSLSQFKNTLKEDLVLDIASKVVISNEIQEQEVYTFNNIFYWIKAQPYYNLNKKADGVVITFSNITTTKKQQEELEVYKAKLENIIAEQTTDLFEKEKLLRITTENFPEGSISLVSMKMEIMYTGGSIYSESAFNTQDLIGKSLKNILPESGYNELIRHLPELYSGVGFQFEVSVGENSFEYTCKPLMENSIVESFIIVSRNITKQKAALDENLKNLNILNNSLNEIYIFNPENLKFEFINEGALQNLGYRMDEMLNMVTVDIKPDFDILKFKELIQPLKDKRTQKLEYR